MASVPRFLEETLPRLVLPVSRSKDGEGESVQLERTTGVSGYELTYCEVCEDSRATVNAAETITESQCVASLSYLTLAVKPHHNQEAEPEHRLLPRSTRAVGLLCSSTSELRFQD